MDPVPSEKILRFGLFELDTRAERLLKDGRTVRLQPQPFKLLCLLAGQAGRLVTREEIQQALWSSDTFVDFEQGVNFAVKQVRDALGEDADRPVYLQTVPKRGYKFVVPVEVVTPGTVAAYSPRTDLSLQKLLWSHIAELRMNEERRQHRKRMLMRTLAGVALVVAVVVVLVVLFR